MNFYLPPPSHPLRFFPSHILYAWSLTLISRRVLESYWNEELCIFIKLVKIDFFTNSKLRIDKKWENQGRKIKSRTQDCKINCCNCSTQVQLFIPPQKLNHRSFMKKFLRDEKALSLRLSLIKVLKTIRLIAWWNYKGRKRKAFSPSKSTFDAKFVLN